MTAFIAQEQDVDPLVIRTIIQQGRVHSHNLQQHFNKLKLPQPKSKPYKYILTPTTLTSLSTFVPNKGKFKATHYTSPHPRFAPKS